MTPRALAVASIGLAVFSVHLALVFLAAGGALAAAAAGGASPATAPPRWPCSSRSRCFTR